MNTTTIYIRCAIPRGWTAEYDITRDMYHVIDVHGSVSPVRIIMTGPDTCRVQYTHVDACGLARTVRYVSQPIAAITYVRTDIRHALTACGHLWG